MGAGGNIQDKIEEGKGKAKEAMGRATDDKRKQAEGQGEQSKAKLKESGDQARAAAKNAADAFRR